MSDKATVLTVVLYETCRVDDLQELISAIGMLKGVAKVEPNVADVASFAAYAKARADLEKVLYEALKREQEKHGKS